jgi:hypothetical protein
LLGFGVVRLMAPPQRCHVPSRADHHLLARRSQKIDKGKARKEMQSVLKKMWGK